MARYAVEVGIMCYVVEVEQDVGVVVILSLRRISRLQLDATKILRACPQNDGHRVFLNKNKEELPSLFVE